jgi:hypothetical protein
MYFLSVHFLFKQKMFWHNLIVSTIIGNVADGNQKVIYIYIYTRLYLLNNLQMGPKYRRVYPRKAFQT